MAQLHEAATEAVGASISAGQSLQEDIKDRNARENVDIGQAPRETSVS